MSIYEDGEEWCEKVRSPVVQFSPGEPVPVWVGRITPTRYQDCLTFASEVEVLINTWGIEVRPRYPLRPGESLMQFSPPWWQRWYRCRFRRTLDVVLHGYPTVLTGVERMIAREDENMEERE